MSKAIIIFVKNPELGRCKTRLAAAIGNPAALHVYKQLLDHTRKTSLALDCVRYLFYDSYIPERDNWNSDLFKKDIQVQEDLGGRMKAAFSKVLSQHDQAIIIGSDCPDISTDLIEDAFEKLNSTDITLGPTYDGGYYLLGMKTVHHFLFDNMKWSTDTVFSESKKRISSHQLTLELTKQLSDLDTIEDLDGFPELKKTIKDLL